MVMFLCWQEVLDHLAHAAEKKTKDGYDLRHTFRKFDG